MKREYVKELPESARRVQRKGKWLAVFEEFVASGEKILEITPDKGEYSSTSTMYSTAWKSMRRYGYNFIIRTTKECIYIIKKD